MNELSTWSYHWSEGGGSSYNAYLRNSDVVRAINGGTAMAAAGLAGCISENTRQLLGSVRSLEVSIDASLAREGDRLARTFTWGFSQMLASLGGMQATLEDLRKLAKSPAQTAAYEHFEIARDAFRQGLYPECLEALGRAVNGVPGVSAGHKLEWRFHQLRGLVLLGSHEHTELETIDPIEAEACFLMAARYAKADSPKDAAKAFLSAGWAAYVQVDRSDSLKLTQALDHTRRALELDPDLGEARFQEAKFEMALGRPTEGLLALRSAAERESLFLAKAAADGDFQRHGSELDRFLEVLRQETIDLVRRELGPLALAIRSAQADVPALGAVPAAMTVVEFGLSPEAKALLELWHYVRDQWPKDRSTLKSLVFKGWRTTVTEHEETVVEIVATGELERVEETVQETYWEEEVQPGGWFRSEKRVRVEKTRPKRVVREVPRMKEVQRTVSRREEKRDWGFYNGLGVFEVFGLDVSAVGIPVVPIYPGTFLMGSPEQEAGRGTDEHPHPVTLSRPFYLAVAPCTQSQWRAVMGSDPSYFSGSDRPVENISWYDAAEFCSKLTEEQRRKGVLPESWKWRLPTEAEWEYAARAGTSGARHGELDAIAWHIGNSGSKTHPVRQKQPNAWGLHDMIGNVWEWCDDWYGEYPSKAIVDPVGPASGSSRVGRGGGWFSDAGNCRAAYRGRDVPGYRNGNLGFRPALSSVF